MNTFNEIDKMHLVLGFRRITVGQDPENRAKAYDISFLKDSGFN